jgi:hypothetical protein
MTEPMHGYTEPVPGNYVTAQRSGLAVAGFVCGLVGLVFCWVPVFGLALAILGVVFGVLGRRHGLGIAGLVLGIIGAIVGVIITIAVFSAASDSSSVPTPADTTVSPSGNLCSDPVLGDLCSIPS